MYSGRGDAALPAPGFPIRASAGQSLFSGSPRLIAAVHALLRLLMPRHPPCALHILTVIEPSRLGLEWFGDLSMLVWPTLCGFQGPERARPGGLPGRSLKTQQHVGPRLLEGQLPGSVDMLGTPCDHKIDGRLLERSSLERR